MVADVRRWDLVCEIPVVIFALQTWEPCSNGRSIQGVYRLELQRLQHQTNFIIVEISEEPGAAGRPSTDDLQSLQARIRSITRDMDALDRSCSAEFAVGLEFAVLHTLTRFSSLPFPHRVFHLLLALQSEQPAQPSHTSCLVCLPTSRSTPLLHFP